MNVTTANRGKEKTMNTDMVNQETSGTQESPSPKSKAKRVSSKKGKPAAKKEARSKKPTRKAKGDSGNKRAEVIAMMKRAKGATLAEIMRTTGWQAHTVRGFVSILGSKGGEKIKSAKNDAGERAYYIA